MRTKLLLIVFIISTFAFSANSNEDTTKIQIENLQKENESLKKEIEIIKAKSESTTVMIDNVDSMYQNNFERMTYLFSILGAIIVFVFPFWMQHTQKKLLKIKEEELNASNEERISKTESDLEQKFTDSKNEYYEKLDEEKKNLEEKLNASNEERISSLSKELEKRFKISQDEFYNKLDETNKILEDSFIQKTKELEQNIIEKTENLEQSIYKLEHSLIAKTNLFSSHYFKDKNNKKDYVNFKISSLYHFYKSNNEDHDLFYIIKEFKIMIENIENEKITIFKKAYEMLEFFEKELTTTILEISEDDKKVFESLKNTLKVKEKVD